MRVGQRVLCKMGGKVSRLEGTAGKWMPGTVVDVRLGSIENGGGITCKLDHRQVETAASVSYQINGLFERDAVKELTDGNA